MFTVSLAPTSAPSRWYSKPVGIQEEYEELAFLEAKFVHEREQALEVQCHMVYPVAFNDNNNSNHNNNSSGIEDPSLEDVAIQDDIHDRRLLPALDDTPMTNSLSFMAHHQPPDDLLHYQAMPQSTGPSRSAHRYSTPGRLNEPSSTSSTAYPADSPDLERYLSPPPAGRSLRQYMDDSSRGFMEPMEMIDRMVRFDDDDHHHHHGDEDNSGASYGDALSEDIQVEYQHDSGGNDEDLASPATRRSNFFS
ncbi:hypothetical protein [Absidia glauca]|uniref:Uncharacterized protein n=1 Tax=Absidia glauca TaxID=4829 RepID=A0A163JE29_ABSGL|nr:hypothetical protein [Absidia glauca]